MLFMDKGPLSIFHFEKHFGEGMARLAWVDIPAKVVWSGWILKVDGFFRVAGTVGLGVGLLKTMHGVCFFLVEREEKNGFGLLINQVPTTQI